MAELEVIIGANTQGIEKGANRAENALKSVRESIKRLQKDIAENITISKGYKSAIDDLSRAFKSGEISQKKYNSTLKRLQRDEKETEIETRRLTKELNNLQREQRQLNAVTPQLINNTKKAGKASRRNNAAWVEFGRVIGDSAYGVEGMANNFQQLAFLMGGPAGISIAISAITTLLIVFGDELFKTKTKVEKLREAQEKLNKT